MVKEALTAPSVRVVMLLLLWSSVTMALQAPKALCPAAATRSGSISDFAEKGLVRYARHPD